MKNLWRIIILFMLPGIVLGGNTIAAFFRLTDGDFEPIIALAAAGAVWTTAAYLAGKLLLRQKRISRFYYTAAALSSILFTSAVGGAVMLFGNGTAAAVTGIIVSAAAMAWAILCLTSRDYSRWDRSFFAGGIIAGGFIWGYAGFYSRLAWMETLFFYLAVFMLLAWAFASPLTRWGNLRKKILWVIVLLAGAAGGFYTVIVFSPPPEKNVLEANSGKLWNKTSTTVNGRRFLLKDKSGNNSYCTPAGSMLVPEDRDGSLQSAMPVLLSVLNKEQGKIELIAPVSSLLPGSIREFAGFKVKHYAVPEALYFSKYTWRRQFPAAALYRIGKDSRISEADILMITALPENQYNNFLESFLEYFMETLKSDGIAVVPGYLLKNPTVFNFMHEKFSCYGVLPAPGELWVFSNQPLDLSVANISRKMQEIFSDRLFSTEGMYEIIYSNIDLWKSSAVSVNLQKLQYGSNSFLGSWWFLAVGIAAALLWRIIRLFGERRNVMYSVFNAVENGFSGMGTLLMILAFLLVNTGVFALFICILTVSFALFLFRWKAGGVWCALAGLLLFLLAAHWGINGTLFMLLIMLQSLLLTGGAAEMNAENIGSRRKMICACFLGMMLAGWLSLAVWLFNIPLLLLWGLIFAARVPGIWQYSGKSVYYKKHL